MAYIFLTILFFILLRKSLKNRPAEETGKTTRVNNQNVVYATVFVYNGDFSTPTYKFREQEQYEESEIVLVDRLGKIYAGRIIEVYDERPEEIPQSVQIKYILGRFHKGDERKVAYWNSDIEKAIYEK